MIIHKAFSHIYKCRYISVAFFAVCAHMDMVIMHVCVCVHLYHAHPYNQLSNCKISGTQTNKESCMLLSAPVYFSVSLNAASYCTYIIASVDAI